MADDLDEAKRLLTLEYDQVRQKIDMFDRNRFQTKSWCLTVAGGLLFLAINSNRAAVCFLALAATWLFGYMEILYINRQQVLIGRSNHLEAIMESVRREGLASPELDSYVFGIRHAFPWPAPRRLDMRALWVHPQTGVLYGGLTLGILVTAIVYIVRLGWIQRKMRGINAREFKETGAWRNPPRCWLRYASGAARW